MNTYTIDEYLQAHTDDVLIYPFVVLSNYTLGNVATYICNVIMTCPVLSPNNTINDCDTCPLNTHETHKRISEYQKRLNYIHIDADIIRLLGYTRHINIHELIKNEMYASKPIKPK